MRANQWPSQGRSRDQTQPEGRIAFDRYEPARPAGGLHHDAHVLPFDAKEIALERHIDQLAAQAWPSFLPSEHIQDCSRTGGAAWSGG